MTDMFEPAREEAIIRNANVQENIIFMVVVARKGIIFREVYLWPNGLKMSVFLEPGLDERNREVCVRGGGQR